MIPIARPQIGPEEEAAVLAVMRSGMLAQGEQVVALEKGFAEVCQVREAIAVSSGTAALHLALLAHGIGPGDEVITSPFSFAATGNTILLVGAAPVFVDSDAGAYNLDPELVERAIASRTKAIMPVHLYGNPADMDRLVPWRRRMVWRSSRTPARRTPPRSAARQWVASARAPSRSIPPRT